MASAQQDVRALLDHRTEACRAKDIDRLMSLYSPDIVYFDVVPPLRFIGTDAVRAISCGGSRNMKGQSAWKPANWILR
ncbi:ketosteroid isomerase-like protein [Rhizobium sp. BK529]|uniref:YybH family protein n=2 Tax=unclassified Rhizobium TaxID=2613769 RepID=UPI0010DC8D48|nr:nuclear transport factor 2 family protein [Rhizobium sp. BK529]MBB3590797.1 ketosteroid isomerase-like protein [Rhizobium sp. BK529]TCS09248.1 SnoaL-like protein [Rhizobium sp. BK418]